MTSIVPTEDFNSLLTMPSAEMSKVTAQMTALLSEMAEEKGNIDSLVTMLEKQPWYKKCIKTVLGKNKATVAEIQQHKDKLASYTSSALAMLYQNNRIEQQQIAFLGEAVNSINGQLATTNYELIKTQAAVAGLKTELSQSMTGLANALNEKITSVDNYHMLIEEINNGTYDSDNIISKLFSVIAQIDRRIAADDRKMDNLRKTLVKKKYLSNKELPLVEYMKMVADLPEDAAGTVYYEFFSLSENDYANMFVDLINKYTFLPAVVKKSKNAQKIIEDIIDAHEMMPDTALSTNELYEQFIEDKKGYLSSIRGELTKNLEADITDVQQIECAGFIPEENATEISEVQQIECNEFVPNENADETSEELNDNAEIEISSEIASQEENSETQEPETEMTDVVISSILQIKKGETKTFSYKNIHISSYINCEGDIAFDHCVIYYNESDAGDEITLKTGSHLSITNSVVICKGFDDHFFITCDCSETVVFENTTFIDCSYFANLHGVKFFTMNKCELRNCYFRFINCHCGESAFCNITDNYIHQNDLKQFNFEGKRYGALIDVFSSNCHSAKVLFADNHILEEEGFRRAGRDKEEEDNRLTYFNCLYADVSNCTFDGISHSITAKNVSECKFENCTECIFIDDYFSESVPSIDNCVFKNCTDVISVEGVAHISNCQFVSCYYRIIDQRGTKGGINIEFCEFINTSNLENNPQDNLQNLPGSTVPGTDNISIELRRIKRPTYEYIDCLRFTRSKSKESKANYIKKCIFDGVNMDDWFLISSVCASEKPYGTVLFVDDCYFKNCSTKRSSGKIIKEYIQYDTLFKKNVDFKAVEIINCRGLDKINKEGCVASEAEIKNTSTTGNRIGATLGAAFVLGGPVGLLAAAGISASLNAFNSLNNNNNETQHAE